MYNSRNIADLDPHVRAVAEKHIFACAAAGIDLIITSTWRDCEKQDALYSIGRAPGDKRRCVTYAKGGQSWHQFRCAWDVVPILGGKCVWDDPAIWDCVVSIGESVGAEAGARWSSFRDLPHFQYVPPGVPVEIAMEWFNATGSVFV